MDLSLCVILIVLFMLLCLIGSEIGPLGCLGDIVAFVFLVVCFVPDKKDDQSFEQGETVTTLVKRVDLDRKGVYILTEDSETFVEYDPEYRLIAPGDTLIYRRNKKDQVHVLSVKYNGGSYKRITAEEEIKEDQHGVVYMPDV